MINEAVPDFDNSTSNLSEEEKQRQAHLAAAMIAGLLSSRPDPQDNSEAAQNWHAEFDKWHKIAAKLERREDGFPIVKES